MSAPMIDRRPHTQGGVQGVCIENLFEMKMESESVEIE